MSQGWGTGRKGGRTTPLAVAVLALAGCAGATDPVPDPVPEPIPVVELPVTLDEGFERGRVLLVPPPPGFAVDLEVVDGWGRLATTPKCVIQARTGQDRLPDDADHDALTEGLLTALASRDGAVPQIVEAELTTATLAPGEGIPALDAAWESADRPVRAVARVASWEALRAPDGSLVGETVVVELRCEGEVEEADLDAAWDHTLGALWVVTPWDRPY